MRHGKPFILLPLAALLIGCASTTPTPDTTTTKTDPSSQPSVTVTPDTIPSLSDYLDEVESSDTPSLAARGTPAIDQAFASANTPSNADLTTNPPSNANRTTPTVTRRANTPVDLDTEPQPDTPAPTVAATPEPMSAADLKPSPTFEQQRLASELAILLENRLKSAQLPFPVALRRHALDLLGVDPASSDNASSDNARLEQRLTPDERLVLDAWSALVEDVAVAAEAGGDVGRIVHALQNAADATAELEPLGITRFTLAFPAVDGFGVLDELPTNDDNAFVFDAGPAHRLIAYAELDRFRTTPDGKGGRAGHAVRLTQQLELLRVAPQSPDDLLVWSSDVIRLDDWSSSPRRDFYTVQALTLPAELGTGRFRLRLTVTDDVSGASAQSILAINLVADSADTGS